MPFMIWNFLNKTINSTPIKNIGQYSAVLNMIIYTGTYKNLNYGQVICGFTTANNEIVYKFYPLHSNGKAAMDADLQILCGNQNYKAQDFDLFSLLGTQVSVDVDIVSEKNKPYPHPIISTISPLKQKFNANAIDLIRFSFEEMEDFDKLPDWIQKTIQESKEWEKIHR